MSVGRCIDGCWQGKEVRLLKDQEKKVLKSLRLGILKIGKLKKERVAIKTLK